MTTSEVLDFEAQGRVVLQVATAAPHLVEIQGAGVPPGEAKTLPGAVLRRFVRRPLEFFDLPRDAGPPEATAH